MRYRRARQVCVLAAALVAVFAGCSFLVNFRDQPTCEGGLCGQSDAWAEGGIEGGDEGRDAGADVRPDAPDADPCAALGDSGAICAYYGGCNCGYCDHGACSVTKKCPEGFNWDAGDGLARCCGGLPVLTNTNANCGVCGIVCKTAGVSTPQDCKVLDGHYLCLGCSSNDECWSQCCSFAPAPAHCAASDCNTGACPNGICPAPTHCVAGVMNSPNYCAY